MTELRITLFDMKNGHSQTIDALPFENGEYLIAEVNHNDFCMKFRIDQGHGCWEEYYFPVNRFMISKAEIIEEENE